MAGRERTAQKDRTRESILIGARELLTEGKTVTVTAAAARVGVSKATAYRYFREPAALAAEAGLAIRVAPLETILGDAQTLREKLMAINLYFFDFAVDNETTFRQFLASAVMAKLSDPPNNASQRGARRVAMYKTVLQSEGIDTEAPHIIRFYAGLGAATGIEAVIALIDVVGLDAQAARVVVEDMTHALIDSFERQNASTS